MEKSPKPGAQKPTTSTPRDRQTPPGEGASDLLPESTRDEQDLIAAHSDDWYQRERPPHHG